MLCPIRRPSEAEFVRKLRSGYTTFQAYDNALLQNKALTVIPREELIKRAMSVMRQRGVGLDYIVELFTIELLAWFKVYNYLLNILYPGALIRWFFVFSIVSSI